MTDLVGAYDAVVARLTGEGSGIDIPIRWQDDQAEPLPDTPAAFVYVEIETERGGIAGFGGGRGANLFRNPCWVMAYVFVPKGQGARVVGGLAETIAARLRSFRDADISCFEGTVLFVGSGAALKPPGLRSDVGAYSCAIAEIAMSYDQIG